MSSILDEKQISLTAAARKLNTHANTVRRWASAGCRGIRLRSWKVGGRRVTSLEAIESLVLESSGKPLPNAKQMRSASHLRAEALLDQMGIK